MGSPTVEGELYYYFVQTFCFWLLNDGFYDWRHFKIRVSLEISLWIPQVSFVVLCLIPSAKLATMVDFMEDTEYVDYDMVTPYTSSYFVSLRAFTNHKERSS